MMLLGGQAQDIALIAADTQRSVTYAELQSLISEQQKLLAEQKPQLVFLLCRNTLETIILYLACLASECPVALLDADLPKDKLQSLIATYHPDVVFDAELVGTKGDALVGTKGEALVGTKGEARVGTTREAGAAGADAKQLRLSSGSEAPSRGDSPVHPSLALLLPTSGSTGSSKFVRLSADNILSNAKSIASALSITPDQRAILSLPLHYSFGLSILNSHLISGASVVLTHHSLTAKPFWEIVRDQHCTSFAGVPFSYEILKRLDINQVHVPELTTFTQAGGKLSPALTEHFLKTIQARNGRFFVMYGQTEATARMTILPLTEMPEKLGSVGKPIPQGHVEVLNTDGTKCGAKEVGEIVYRGPNVMMGYATNREDLALGDVVKGELHTGDLGYLDQDGFLYITGRTQRICKIFGLRLSLDDIEAQLQRHGSVAAISDDKSLKLFCESPAYESLASKRAELASSWGIHPSALAVRQIEVIPRKGNGKIDYKALEQLAP